MLLGLGFRAQGIFVTAAVPVFVVTVLMAILGRLRRTWQSELEPPHVRVERCNRPSSSLPPIATAQQTSEIGSQVPMPTKSQHPDLPTQRRE